MIFFVWKRFIDFVSKKTWYLITKCKFIEKNI